MKKTLWVLGSIFIAAGCATTPKKEVVTVKYPTTIAEAVSSDFRTENNKKRDEFRHPQETLNFFGLQPNMTVVEIWPSAGWYTQILAPLLVTDGKYIIADPPEDPRGYTTPRTEWLKTHADLEAKIIRKNFHPETHLTIVEPGTADMVLTFRNIHNWNTTANQEAAFKAFFAALKSGGVLGVVEHRANEKGKFNPKSGYIKESTVIKMAEKAGFKLAEKSEINANPKDTKNYKDGVWTLPPSLKLGDKDKEKYLAIGESDRMTLKFIKP